MFRIGEFSKLSQVSVRMLRHYDKIDLLVPEKIDEFTGYRYYSAMQLITINRIQELKRMGLSLNTIKEILKNYSDDQSFKNYLKLKKSEIEENMKEMQNQICMIESSIKRLEEDSIMKYNVNVKDMPERKVASLRQVIASYPEEGKLWAMLRAEDNPDVEIQMAVEGDYKDTENVKFVDIDAMKVASVMMKGGYEQISEVNATVVNWVENSNYEFAGEMFSIYHVGPADTDKDEELVTEICFPIKER